MSKCLELGRQDWPVCLFKFDGCFNQIEWCIATTIFILVFWLMNSLGAKLADIVAYTVVLYFLTATVQKRCRDFAYSGAFFIVLQAVFLAITGVLINLFSQYSDEYLLQVGELFSVIVVLLFMPLFLTIAVENDTARPESLLSKHILLFTMSCTVIYSIVYYGIFNWWLDL